MYKNTELLYKYARAFFANNLRLIFRRVAAFLGGGAIISLFSASREKGKAVIVGYGNEKKC